MWLRAEGPILRAAVGRQGEEVLSEKAGRESALHLPAAPGCNVRFLFNACLRSRGRYGVLHTNQPCKGAEAQAFPKAGQRGSILKEESPQTALVAGGTGRATSLEVFKYTQVVSGRVCPSGRSWDCS